MDDSGFESQQKLLQNVHTCFGVHSVSCSMAIVVLSEGQSEGGVKLTTHVNLMPRLRTRGAIIQLPLYAVMEVGRGRRQVARDLGTATYRNHVRGPLRVTMPDSKSKFQVTVFKNFQKIQLHSNKAGRIIILKWAYKKWDGESWTALIWLGTGRGCGLLLLQ